MGDKHCFENDRLLGGIDEEEDDDDVDIIDADKYGCCCGCCDDCCGCCDDCCCC